MQPIFIFLIYLDMHNISGMKEFYKYNKILEWIIEKICSIFSIGNLKKYGRKSSTQLHFLYFSGFTFSINKTAFLNKGFLKNIIPSTKEHCSE